jgi:ABC-2 type transport system ATP-binding protein
MIRARGLTKRYGAKAALADVSFDLSPGERLGVRGLAGSGRSTLLRIAATLIPPTSGTLLIDGIDPALELAAARTRLAFAGSDVRAGLGLRVAEYLQLILRTRGAAAGIEGTRRIREALSTAGVSSALLVHDLPPTGRAAVALAAALLARPAVLVVDDRVDLGGEAARSAFHGCLSEAVARGSALLIASDDERVPGTLWDRELRLEGGRVVPASRPRLPEPATSDMPPRMLRAGAGHV